MIRKESSQGVGYSVVELNGTRQVLASAVPRQGDDLRAQAHDALRTIQAVTEEEGTLGSIVRQAVFMRDIGQRGACREVMAEFYGDQLPATIYIPQPPCGGKLVEIEALGVGGTGPVQIRRYPEQTVVCRHDGASWLHFGSIVPETTTAGVYERSLDAFQRASRRLVVRGFSFEQVIRTWLYLGDIVGSENDRPRYMELNRARSDFYRGIRFGVGLTPPGWDRPVYPASTGIGTEGKDVEISGIALSGLRQDLTLLPLENPQQVSAYDYGHQFGSQSPKFARAMAVVTPSLATIFVSGTASIVRSETQSIGDVEGQTRQTLENISALIGEENFRRHGMPGVGATLADLGLVRVYVKRQEDYHKARAICEARLGELPAVYAVADICRPELLVEIEGIAFCGRAG